MIIEERIYQLLVPSVMPALYPQIAPDKATTPYTTYVLWNKINLTSHSAPLPATRVWAMQFSTFGETYIDTRTRGAAIETALVGYTDAAIQGVTQDRVMTSFDDIAKLYCTMIELQIAEQLS